MMRKLDQRGVAAFEFCIVAMAIFALIFAIFDLGRYAIAMQSVRSLAGAGARLAMINDCYTNAVLTKTTPTCSGEYLSLAQKQALAPFLYANSGSVTVNTVTGGSSMTVTATASFNMMFSSLWPTSFNNPSASTSIPF